MNVGLFTDSYYPEINGVATSVLTLKNELENLGHTVYVFTTTTPGAPEHEHNVFRVPSLPCIFITERRVGLFYQHKLASIIKKLELDLIHTHTEFSLGIFGRLMARDLKIPMVHTYHTIYEDYTHYVTSLRVIDKRAKAFVRVFTRVCCNHVEQVIAPTEKVKELLIHYKVVKDISVVPTGVSLHKFNPDLYRQEDIDRVKKEIGIKEGEKVLLYIGRISKEKNISEIIDGMPEFMARHDNVKFILIGGGPDEEVLKKKIADLKLEGNIQLIGPRPWDSIGLYYQIGDVFVSASTSETQGLTFIEAMAAGLPVVARQDRCLEDILEEGYNGYTFTTKEGLVNGLESVLFGDEVPFKENSRNKVKQYSTEEFAKSIEKVYSQVMERSDILLAREKNEGKKISHLFYP